MRSQPHHHNGTPTDWLQDAAFLILLLSAFAVIATFAVLLVAF